MLLISLLVACASLECGPGTKERDGACYPADDVTVIQSDSGLTTSDSGADGGDGSDGSDGSDGASDSGDTGGDTATPAPVLQVYILAGQSNMDGYAWYPGLTPSEQLADPRVPLYWSGWGEFRDLQAASYGGTYNVGPEVTFGRTMADAGRTVALVKHAVGGTDLANYWYPGVTPGDASAGPGFAVLVDSMEAAASALDATGEPWEWAGFLWMQGESDAVSEPTALAYEENLTGLIAAIRAVTGEPTLPIALGLISRESIWTYADTVRAADLAVAAADPHVFTLETDDLPRKVADLAHYDGISNRILGRRFARALLEEASVPAGDDAPTAAFTFSAGSSDYDFTGTCGWEFSLSAPIEVTDVGAYGSTYLGTPTDVGFWDTAGNLLYRVTVPSWLEAPAISRGSIWYVAVEPFRLEPGTYRIGLVSWSGDSDRYLNDVTGSFAPELTYTAAVYTEGYWLGFPSVSFASTTMNFLGPSFLFVEG